VLLLQAQKGPTRTRAVVRVCVCVRVYVYSYIYTINIHSYILYINIFIHQQAQPRSYQCVPIWYHICVLMLLCMCPHTKRVVPPIMCPHTTQYVS
jgi:hypothetical protein